MSSAHLFVSFKGVGKKQIFYLLRVIVQTKKTVPYTDQSLIFSK